MPLPRPTPSQSLASVKPRSTSNGLCHTTSLAHAKSTSGSCHLTVTSWQYHPRIRQGELRASATPPPWLMLSRLLAHATRRLPRGSTTQE
ncbi:hypothetical protein ACFX16_012168 [Malus domestica]